MTEPQMSGADLAIQALRQARAAAKTKPTQPKRRPRAVRADRTGGRDPHKFGSILDQLAVAYNWQRPSAGGLLMARWSELAPDLAALATPERFDADTRTLHLRPVSAAAGTKLRWEATRIPAALNAAVGQDAIATVRILAPGATTNRPDLEAPAVAPERPTEPAPPRTRAEAPAGYHRALEAALAGRERAAAADPTAEARDRMFGDIRGTLREPETAFVDAVAALEDIAPPSRGNDSETIRQAAIKRARDERAGRAPAIPTAFQRTA